MASSTLKQANVAVQTAEQEENANNNKKTGDDEGMNHGNVHNYQPRRGRHPFLQLLTTWLLLILATAIFALTVYYAFNTTLFVSNGLINQSPSSTILVIRILSGVSSFLMTALVGKTLERASWMFVARCHGLELVRFLALSGGTGVMGLFKLAFASQKIVIDSRLWAIFRLTILALVNALGIIILSNVNTRVVFLCQNNFPVSAGVGDFNASLVDDFSTIAGIQFATDFNNFLGNTQRSFAVTAVDSQKVHCATDGSLASTCIVSYYVPGGLDFVSPWPTKNNTLLSLPIYTIEKVNGYQFDFSKVDPSARFDGTKDCNIYGDPQTAIQFCLGLSNETVLNLKILPCPSSLAANQNCLNNTSWHSSTGWTSSMQSYHRTATVHYSRSNSSIISIEDLSDAQPRVIEPHDLFHVYNISFRPSGGFNEFTAGGQFISYLHNVLSFAETSQQGYARALSSLQGLTALPLFYFQPNYLNVNLLSSSDTPTRGLPASLYARASFSEPSYRLVVGNTSLYIYTAFGAFVIVFCTAALVLGSLNTTAGGIPEIGAWPVIDLAVNCSDMGTDSGRDNTLPQQLQACRGSKGNQLLRRLRDIRVFTAS